MIEVKIADESFKESWNDFVVKNHGHILQSWEWGQFRAEWGTPPVRVVLTDNGEIKAVCSFTLHKIPLLNKFVGYAGKGPVFSNIKYLKPLLDGMRKVGQEKSCIFIKLEPNETSDPENFFTENLVKSGKTIFAAQTLEIDLTRDEEELLSSFHPKWRYNIRLAEKKGVTIHEGTTDQDLEEFLTLQRQTASRDKFFIHPDKYYSNLWKLFHPLGLAHLITAKYENRPIASWFLFSFGDYLYYPYGSSGNEYRNLMPSHALMWASIKLGQKLRLKVFDLWGAQAEQPSSPARKATETSVSQTGVDENSKNDWYQERVSRLDEKDAWAGFTKFKLGFNPTYKQFLGAYDLVLNKPLYHTVAAADKIRWLLLRSFK